MATWQAMMRLEEGVAGGGEDDGGGVRVLAGEVQCEAMSCHQASNMLRPVRSNTVTHQPTAAESKRQAEVPHAVFAYQSLVACVPPTCS
jgi:hypothetical protein